MARFYSVRTCACEFESDGLDDFKQKKAVEQHALRTQDRIFAINGIG